MLPPKIVHVLPPLEPFRYGLAFVIRLVIIPALTLLAFVGAAVLAPMLSAGLVLDRALLSAIAGELGSHHPIRTFILAWVGFTALVWLAHWDSNRNRRKTRQRMLEENPDLPDDPDSLALSDLWLRAPFTPIFRLAPRLLKALGPSDRMRIVCNDSVPAVPNMPVEPLVITLPARPWVQAVGAIALCAAVYAGLFSLRSGVAPSLVASASACFILGAIAWGWHVLAYPRYLRIAPGIIQVLRYGPFRSSPAVAEYPLEGRTALFISITHEKVKAPTRFHVRLCLTRDVRCDSFAFTIKGADLIERFWQALLSTAPGGPLSKTELVG